MLKSIGVLLFCIAILLSSAGSAFAACPEGDLDDNCKVDFGDVMFLAERWLAGPGSQADIVGGDGVNFGDYAVVAAHWLEQGQTTGSVRVSISPPDVIVGGAQWMVDGGERHDSGETG